MISLLKAIKNQNISGDAVMQSKVDDMTALLEIIAEELDTAGGIDGDRILSLPSVRNWF